MNIGDRVESGDVLCIFEAMKLFNEIQSDYAARSRASFRRTASWSRRAKSSSGSSHEAIDYKAQRGFDALLADRRGSARRAALPARSRSDRRRDRGGAARGKTIYWCGNGGSAAEAQHMAAELSGRYLRERPGLNSEALSVNTSTLTCVGNDYGYDYVFARQVEAFVQPGDVVIGMTTSGTSRNVVLALEAAQEEGRGHDRVYRQRRRHGHAISPISR